MDQLQDHADDRLINGCIYCGGPSETRDHVPSRCLLDPPYPDGLPVVGSCEACNQQFSKDEEYFVCLIEAAISGSADPDKIRRPSIARALRRSPALRARLESARRQSGDTVEFEMEEDRVSNVMLKLARGHAAFELSQLFRRAPDRFWCRSLAVMPKDECEAFEAPHIQQLLGEIGSRGTQRMLVTEMTVRSKSGKEQKLGFLVNDWVHVQDGLYRYLAIDDTGGVTIRIVVAETLGCEVIWRTGSGE